MKNDQGSALVMAVMCTLLMAALGAALVLTASSETMIADNYRKSLEGLYAADAAAERALGDLVTIADWNPVLSGAVRSSFTDGSPSGARVVPGGAALDLGQAVNLANCEKTTACTSSELNAVTADRPWGPNNPRWRLYAYGRLADLLPAGTITSSFYVMVFVGDDPAENDGDPLQDGVDPLVNAGAGVLAVRAESRGPKGSRRVVELTLGRTGVAAGGKVRVLSWRQTR